MFHKLIQDNVFALAHMIRMNWYIHVFPPWFSLNGTWTKTKLVIIEHFSWPVNDWTLWKRFQIYFGYNLGLCRVLSKHKVVITIRATMTVLRFWLLRSLQEFNCCRNSRSMNFIAILFQLSLKNGVSLCHVGTRQSRNCWWFFSLSRCYSCNNCAGLYRGSPVQSMRNRGASEHWLWAFGLTAVAACW